MFYPLFYTYRARASIRFTAIKDLFQHLDTLSYDTNEQLIIKHFLGFTDSCQRVMIGLTTLLDKYTHVYYNKIEVPSS